MKSRKKRKNSKSRKLFDFLTFCEKFCNFRAVRLPARRALSQIPLADGKRKWNTFPHLQISERAWQPHQFSRNPSFTTCPSPRQSSGEGDMCRQDLPWCSRILPREKAQMSPMPLCWFWKPSHCRKASG